MSDRLSDIACAKAFNRTTTQLLDGLVSPDAEAASIEAGAAIHEFMSAADLVRMLPDEELRPILSDLELSLSLVRRRLLKLRFSA